MAEKRKHNWYNSPFLICLITVIITPIITNKYIQRQIEKEHIYRKDELIIENKNKAFDELTILVSQIRRQGQVPESYGWMGDESDTTLNKREHLKDKLLAELVSKLEASLQKIEIIFEKQEVKNECKAFLNYLRSNHLRVFKRKTGSDGICSYYEKINVEIQKEFKKDL